MKKVSIFASLAIVIAVASAFTSSNKFLTTYHLYSVTQDQVANANGNTMSSYTGKFRTDLNASLGNDISSTESISTWIASNPSPDNTLSAFCDVVDADQICVVKFNRVDGVNTSVLEFKSGDSQQ